MSDMQVSDKLARPVRGAVQGTTALIVVEFADAWVYDMSDKQYGAAVALLAIVLSYVQIVTENFFGKALLREIPEAATPVIDEAGRHEA